MVLKIGFSTRHHRRPYGTLEDSVTVLRSELAEEARSHQVTVRRWRNELVAYREKTPTEFLAEVRRDQRTSKGGGVSGNPKG